MSKPEPLEDNVLNAIEKYGELLNNTGGNPPAELLEDLRDDERMFSTNIVRYLLAMAVKSQVTLILRLQAEGLLITKEQLETYRAASWAANPDRMGS